MSEVCPLVDSYDLPIIPALPVLGKIASLVNFNAQNTHSSILIDKRVYKVSSGGSAIYFALKAHNIQPGDQVLIPSYHCTAMVEPVINMGAAPVFYSITHDINIDVNDISSKINEYTKAILVPHFFGKKQDISELKQQCEITEKICIIEDCAHAFFELLDIDSAQGDYLIGSLTKFFPAFDGGLLVSKHNKIEGVKPLPFKQEIKAIYNVFHDAVRYGRMGSMAWMFNATSYIRHILKSATKDEQYQANNIDEQGVVNVNCACTENEVSGLEYSSSKISSYIAGHCNFKDIIKKRQRNYFRIIKELESVVNIDLSLNCFDTRFVPYMVVARLHRPEIHHEKLISKGLPIWRWENIYSSDCLVAEEYSKSIIQIPCHQELSDKEIIALVDGIKRIVRED